MTFIPRSRVSATGSSIDRFRVTEIEPAGVFPSVGFSALTTFGETTYRQWNSHVGAALESEGAGGTDLGYWLREAGETRIKIRLDLGAPAPATAALGFTTSGTAVSGTHYTLATASPITVAQGQDFVEIWVDPIDGSKWFTEKSLIFKLAQGTTSGLTVDEGKDEFRLYLRPHPTRKPPAISFDQATETGVPGAYTVDVVADAASLEAVTVYYRLSGQVFTDGNYTITGGAESGSLTIPAGSTSATLGYTITGSPGVGDDLVFTFEHESNTVHKQSGLEDVHVDENEWHHTEDWNFEQDRFGNGREWPGDPSSHLVAGTRDADNVEKDSLQVIEASERVSVPATAPDGGAIQALVIAPWAELNSSVSYIRESFADEYQCGGPTLLNPLKTYNLAACRWGSFGAPDDAWNARFLLFTFRVRTKDLNHKVVIDRFADSGSPVDYEGNPTTSWTMGSETWALWWSSLIDPTYTTFGAIRQRFDGEGNVVTSGGTEVNTFWMLHKMGGTFNGKVENDDGSERGNMILRPVWCSDGADRTGEVWKKPLEAIGYGHPLYWPWFQSSDTALTGPPTKFWHKKGRWWEPRGYAALTSGAQHTHTYTR